MANIIYDKIKANLQELATYGVLGPIVDAYRTTIDNYNDAIPKPRTGIVVQKNATTTITTITTTTTTTTTTTLKQLFAATDSLL